MKIGKTDIHLILDRSGSIRNVLSDIVGGVNSFIEQQKNVPGECNISLYKFNDLLESIYKNKPIAEAQLITNDDLNPQGMTSLLDSIGTVIDDAGKYYASLDESERPEKVLVIVATDGEENNSRKYVSKEIFDKVQHQEKKYNWKFVFIGADIDAWAVGGNVGIAASSTLNISKTAGHITGSFDLLSSKSAMFRSVNYVATQDFFSAEDYKSKGFDSPKNIN